MKEQKRRLAILGFILVITPCLNATSVVKRNLIDLVKISERIIVGQVIGLTDGIDPNTSAPYTQVTLRLSEKIKGSFNSDVFTFRQFGLLKPRPTPDGKHVNLLVTPPGFPRFKIAEDVLLFLCREASITGFCTTVGLFQGKFVITNSRIVNGYYNQELFKGVSTSGLSLTNEEQKLLLTKSGPLSSKLFISLVKKMTQIY